MTETRIEEVANKALQIYRKEQIRLPIAIIRSLERHGYRDRLNNVALAKEIASHLGKRPRRNKSDFTITTEMRRDAERHEQELLRGVPDP